MGQASISVHTHTHTYVRTHTHTHTHLTLFCSPLPFLSHTDVFVDKGKKTYQDLGYKRYNFLSIWVALFTKITRSAISAAKAQSIQGNLSGDGLQNGGTLIVAKGGEQVLLDHHENDIGDHVANEAILNALSLTEVTR